MEAGDVDVFPAVIIKVADGHAIAPSAKIQSGLCRHVGKGSIMIVVVKARRMAFAGAVVLNRGTIDQKDVHPAVIVIIERGRSTTLRFNDVELFPAAAVQVEVDASGRSE